MFENYLLKDFKNHAADLAPVLALFFVSSYNGLRLKEHKSVLRLGSRFGHQPLETPTPFVFRTKLSRKKDFALNLKKPSAA